MPIDTNNLKEITEAEEPKRQVQSQEPKEPKGILKYIILLIIILATVGISFWAYFVFNGYIRPFFNHREASPVVSETNKNRNSNQNLDQNQNQNLNSTRNANLINNVNTVKEVPATKIPANEEDYDADGLTNVEEHLTYGTDPGKWDSDGDYYSDKEELDSGNDPLVATEISAIADWSNYTSIELGLTFRYPTDWGTLIGPEQRGSEEDFVTMILPASAESFDEAILLIVYHKDSQREDSFSYDGSAPEVYCPRSSDYNQKGNVCRVITIGDKIKAIQENRLFEKDYRNLGSTVVFPIDTESVFVGFGVIFSLLDIYNELIQAGATVDPSALDTKAIYQEAQRQSENIFKLNNLSPKDRQKLNTIFRFLQTVRFL